MRLLIVLFLAITLFITFSPSESKVSAKESESLAKCAMPTFDNGFRDSKAIFAGKVLSVRTDGDEKIFKFRAEKYWKGKVGKIIEVRYYETTRYQAWLQVGKRYLVYARGNNNGTLSDGRCSMTKNYSEASSDLNKLGKGKIVK